MPEVLKNVQTASVLDRGLQYKSTFYDSYIAAIGTKRHTGSIVQSFVLDQNTAKPVTLRIVEVDAEAFNGKTSNENDLSLSVRI